jgi:peptidyl-prolyl cis-trans isomerase D
MLADAAKDLGLTSQNTGLFAKTGGQGLTANNLFVTAAFSPEVLEQGNASDVIEIEPNRVVVLKKTDRKPSQLQPLAVVKDQITTVVRAEKTQALLEQQAQAFVAALNSGKSFDEQAKAAGITVKTVAGVSRTDKDTDREVLQYAFTVPAPVADKPSIGSVKTGAGDVAVVSLAGVHLAGEDKVPAEQKTSIATQLTNIRGEYDFKSYQSHLQEVAKIKHR